MSNEKMRLPFLACNSEVSTQSALSAAEHLDDVMRDFANGDRKALGRISMKGMAEVLSFIRQAALATQRQAEPVVLTSEDVAEARALLARCSSSAVLSGDDDEARDAFDDRAAVYRMVCEANALLIGDTQQPQADEVTDAQRYRWLRHWHEHVYAVDDAGELILKHHGRGPSGESGERLDAAIDAAMQKETQ